MLKLIAAILVGFCSFTAYADPALTNVSEQEFEDVAKEFSANFMHHSVQGAASLGSIFGFEIGLVAGQQATPKLNDLIKRAGGDEVPNLYHAGLLGVLTVPFGITSEVIYLPKTSMSNASLEFTSLAAKLTFNDHLLSMIPFNLALRGFMSNSKFSFKQTSGGIDGEVTNDNTVTGFQVLASPGLPIVEPYVGVGMISAKNELGIKGTGSIFNNTFTSEQTADVNMSSTQTLLGVTADFLILSAGLEYSSAFGASAYTAKLALGF